VMTAGPKRTGKSEVPESHATVVEIGIRSERNGAGIRTDSVKSASGLSMKMKSAQSAEQSRQKLFRACLLSGEVQVNGGKISLCSFRGAFSKDDPRFAPPQNKKGCVSAPSKERVPSTLGGIAPRTRKSILERNLRSRDTGEGARRAQTVLIP